MMLLWGGKRYEKKCVWRIATDSQECADPCALRNDRWGGTKAMGFSICVIRGFLDPCEVQGPKVGTDAFGQKNFHPLASNDVPNFPACAHHLGRYDYRAAGAF